MIDLKFSVHEMFTHVVHVCSQHGYINQDEAQIRQIKPTSEVIKQSLMENYFDDNTPEYETATRMVEWLQDKSKSGISEFLGVCRVFLDTGIDDFSNIGTLASLYRSFNVYNHNIDNIAKLKVINFIDAYYGVERVDHTIKLKYLFNTLGFHPLNGFDHHFKSEIGHKLMLHKPKDLKLVVNDWYNFRGKIKKHTLKHGIKTTVLRGRRNDITPFHK